MNNKLSTRDFSMVISLLIIWAIFTILSPTFVSSRNLSMLMIEFSIIAILALGMFLVILPGHIDLSVGSGVGLFGGIASVLVFQYSWAAPLAMFVSLILAIITWWLMGMLVVKQKIPAFIITLGGLLIFKGSFWLVIQNSTIPVVKGGNVNLYSLLTTYYLPAYVSYTLCLLVIGGVAYRKIVSRNQRKQYGFTVENVEVSFMKVFVTAQAILLFVLVSNEYRGVPLPIVILATLATLVYILTQHTKFGRYLYAVGSNEKAAFISGIPVEKLVIMSFATMGAIVALTGFMQTAYAGSSTTTIGNLMELDAIAACVIGGTSLKGGRGNVMGVLFGALIMVSLLNGMTLLAISPEIKFIARGTVLTLAVWMDVRLAND
ncbi:sugar ABC transporter permease [Candidatus Uabimicrobium sp. HlEnr_7]|uniref:sugar ABC transporter permease n=1 Tax=Candidatus Uabimicrobium helgolandensis TaxID=3095367 RepID=UPI003555FC7F